MFALAVALILIFILTMMFFMGKLAAGRSVAGKVTARLTGIALTALIVSSFGLSFQLHGPASRFKKGSVELIIRQWLILPGEFACLLLPVVCSVAYFTLRTSRRPRLLSVCILAIASLPFAIALAIYTGCNHDGACF
jgi:hypothetical protein